MAEVDPKGSVLIVEDRAPRAAALIEALGSDQLRFEVLAEVLDIESALGEQSQWDCVLVSADLHHVSWASVRRAMRKFDVQVPVVVLADHRNVEAMTTALQLGATDFFVKPTQRAGLLRRSIERCVHHRQLQRELKTSKESLEQANTQLRHSLRMLEQDQQAGRQVQMALLPADGLKVADYWISHQIYTSLYLSGDFTDYFQVGEREISFFLADVSGHGSSSAFATVLLKNLFARKRSDYLRRNDHSISSPVSMLKLANRELLELQIDKYATMVVGVIDFQANTLRYSVAGHLPQPILLTDESISYLEGEGPPVGLIPTAEYQEYSRELPETFIMEVFSDGILELLTNVPLAEKEQELLRRLEGPIAKPRELGERLGVYEAARENLPDDVAALMISRGLG